MFIVVFSKTLSLSSWHICTALIETHLAVSDMSLDSSTILTTHTSLVLPDMSGIKIFICLWNFNV